MVHAEVESLIFWISCWWDVTGWSCRGCFTCKWVIDVEYIYLYTICQCTCIYDICWMLHNDMFQALRAWAWWNSFYHSPQKKHQENHPRQASAFHHYGHGTLTWAIKWKSNNAAEKMVHKPNSRNSRGNLCIYIYIYVPRTQMTSVRFKTGKGLVLGRLTDLQK